MRRRAAEFLVVAEGMRVVAVGPAIGVTAALLLASNELRPTVLSTRHGVFERIQRY